MKKRDTAKSLETRMRILETAERLFGEIGVPATTQRKVAEVAGIRVSNVYYYFSSKQDLHRAIILERIKNVMARQDELLELARERAPGGKLSCEAIVHAYAAPRLFEIKDSSSRHLLSALFSYVITGEEADVKEYRELGLRQDQKFLALLCEAMPDFTELELKVRLTLLNAALCGLVGIARHVSDDFPKDVPADDYKKMIMAYFTAAFVAPQNFKK
ncbi:MAG: TetR/AcrR family transcriptional regulator [Opitutales bacterium]|nr:TetR/AcrR family transcriptional regulator [Opitutales bacterium]